MFFIWTQFKMLLAALTLMGCALVATIGIMAVIRRFAPNVGPWDGTDQRLPGLKNDEDEDQEVRS